MGRWEGKGWGGSGGSIKFEKVFQLDKKTPTVSVEDQKKKLLPAL